MCITKLQWNVKSRKNVAFFVFKHFIKTTRIIRKSFDYLSTTQIPLIKRADEQFKSANRNYVIFMRPHVSTLKIYKLSLLAVGKRAREQPGNDSGC